MQIILTFVALICFVGAGIATPVGIGFAIYDWAHGVELSMSMWNGFLTWLKMVLLVIPGLFCYFIAICLDNK